MHGFFTDKKAGWLMAGSTAVLILYCMYNFIWNEPHIDFRPFKNGANIAAIRITRGQTQAEVKIVAFSIKDKKNRVKITEVGFDEYMKNAEKYGDDANFEVLEQIKTEASIPRTKVSEFEITDFDGVDFTDKYLANAKYHFMVISPKVKFSTESKKATVQDSIFMIDSSDVQKPVKKFLKMMNKEISKTNFIWPTDL